MSILICPIQVAAYWHQVILINDYQKTRFSQRILASLFHTLTRKKITIFGFTFKKNTADTRDSAAIHICKQLLDEGAHLVIVDPQVEPEQVFLELSNIPLSLPDEALKDRVRIEHDDYMEACAQSHAIVVCTEWDCFRVYDYKRIYDVMQKPAFIFDGRLILDHAKLISIGFHVEAIGKSLRKT